MKSNSGKDKAAPAEFAAFTRTDLLVTLLILAVLAGSVFIGLRIHSRNQERAACRENLRQIGKAMAVYTPDNDGRLPYAGLRPRAGEHWSWDDLINRQLGGNFTVNQLRSSHPTTDMPVLRCPSDRVPLPANLEKIGVHRRSYAMPSHDMQEVNWPPGPENRTGIGIIYDVSRHYPFVTESAPEPGGNSEKGPTNNATGGAREVRRRLAFSVAMIPNPAKTIATTERIVENNEIGSLTGCNISDINRHVEVKGLSASSYHAGKPGYLFIDGHVESLAPLSTVDRSLWEKGLESGMWIVNQNGR